ncbi:TrkH family potassium uptake protein [uncultured Megasphaera sp.]|uniref:TrkH family potassium uptake protein n=1 Tax=uncultured Megasphaera sp. TaxID=165188 RepID=UPI002658F93F|nr:TrkH family potassium uptake protein [uncultured Megasphaera sp.]
MEFQVIYRFLGKIAYIQAAVFLIPFGMALWLRESSWAALLFSALAAAAAGRICMHSGRLPHKALTTREGIAITGLGWFLATFLGMLPYVLGGYLGLLDGIFESISGFTGTGATVIEDIEALPQSILLWRSMTHWLGGLGIVVIFIALLPEAGQSTVAMYNAEAAGPSRERILPRFQDMIHVLFRMYSAFTVIALVVFLLCGMDGISAVNHALSTISAGGFSTYNRSAAYFSSPWIEGWMTVFMILVGGNFGLYYQVYRKGPGVLRHNTEFKAYILILVLAMTAIGLNLCWQRGETWSSALRYASFQTASIATTGLVSADYDQWPPFSKGILLLLMISGGCAGSVAAGIKISRLVLLIRALVHTITQKVHPQAVQGLQMNGSRIGSDAVIRAYQFFFLYIALIVLWALLLTWDGIGMFDAIGISVSTMGCIGPAFGITGATCTYAGLSDFSKTILCVSMLLGRLEMFTLLVMCRRSFWNKKGNW